MQFVWFYVHGPGDGAELRLSIQSVKKHFAGDVRTTIIGDCPRWYSGHCLRKLRVELDEAGRSRALLPFHDTRSKFLYAFEHSEIDSKFVWMMDDVYFLRPVDLAELETPRYDPWYKEKRKTAGVGSAWHRLISDTFRAVREDGGSPVQYSTHLPHVFEKEKIGQMIERFDFRNRLLLFENLYSNLFRSNPEVYSPFLLRLLRSTKPKELDVKAQNATVLNYTANCWNLLMRRWLEARLG